MKKNLGYHARWMSALAAFCFGASLNQSLAVGEVLIPSLKTANGDYKSVKIFTRTKTHLSFSHENGTAVIKVAELESESLAALDQSRAGTPETSNQVPGAMVIIKAQPKPEPDPAWLAQTKAVLGKIQLESAPVAVTRQQAWTALAALVFAWWVFSLCVSLICRKTGRPGGWLAWVPVFQMLPLFRAAGMSRWWFLGMFVPVLNLIGQVLWCVKVTQARGKGFLTAVMLILPGTNILAFLYLAFANGHAQAEDSFIPIRAPHALAVN